MSVLKTIIKQPPYDGPITIIKQFKRGTYLAKTPTKFDFNFDTFTSTKIDSFEIEVSKKDILFDLICLM